MPKVSVILTSYNHAKYLRESIESVLNQTFTDFELIIGDDASTDESWDIIQSYTDPRIRAYRHENSIGGGFINEFVSSGRVSDLIAINHSDDVWELQKLEKQVAFMDTHSDIGAVFSNALIIGEDGGPFEDPSHFYSNIFNQPNRNRYEWLNHFFYNGNALCHPSVLIRKQCYDDCGLFRYGLAQIGDLDMWVRLCLKYEIHVLLEKLVRFRVRINETNSSGNRQDARIRGQFEFFQTYENYSEIKTSEEFIKVFPSAKEYFTKFGFDLGFALGMVALEPGTFPTAKLFGLQLLFDAINDAERAKKIDQIYGFGHIKFAALSAKHDIFSIESKNEYERQLTKAFNKIIERDEQIVECDKQIAILQRDLNSVSTTLTKIYASKGWHLLTPLRWFRGQQIRASKLFSGLLLLLLRPRDIFNLLRGALHIWRREGWMGVKSSILFYTNYYLEASSDGKAANVNSLYNYLRSGRKESFPDMHVASENYAPTVSVIVPNFNHSAYLEKRLNSIYEQTYQNFEVILLDDCSTDGSVSILSKYATEYSEKTRYYFNDRNSGSPFSQWEKGMLLAEGELIWIAESDDFCEKDFLEKLVPLFFNDSILLSYAHPVFVDSNGKRHPFAFENYVSQINSHKWNTSYIETSHHEVNTALGLLNTIPNVSGVLFRKLDNHFALFSDPNWKKMQVCGDWLFYLNVIRGGSIAYSRDTHNYYRMYPSSTSKKTHGQDIYYQEHERIALTIANLYKIPSGLLVKFQSRLRDFYLKNVEDSSPEKFDVLFDLNKITQSMQERKPNILMAVYGLAFGGGEVFPIRLANALQKAGAAVTLFNGGYEPTQPGVRKMLSPQIAVVMSNSALRINDLLAKYGIEIIHSQHASMENYFAVTRAKGDKNRVIHVATMHGMYEMMDNFMYNTKSIQKSVDYWVYTAEKNILPFIKNGLFNTEKFTKIENGLPSPNPHKVNLSSLGITPDSFVACLASRALADKGWFEAIEATKKAREYTNKDVHLLLIGEGPVYDLLKNEQLPDFIHLLGYIANLDDYLASTQLGLLPTYFKGESFPLILIQFFMAGIPVIASNIGEISKMIKINEQQIGGSLIELHDGKVDSNELANAMIKMIIDREFYDECGMAAHLLKNRFDIDNVAQQYLAIYKHILE